MSTSNPYRNGAGWKPDLPDQRDRKFDPAGNIPDPIPEVVDLRSGFPPVYTQGKLGSCSACAVAGAFQYLMKKQKLRAFKPSRLFIYYNERVIENCVSTDDGASIRAGIKTLKKHGVCAESMWPYRIRKFARKPLKKCYTEALQHQLLSYHRLRQSVPEMKTCLAQGYPFVFGFSYYESFMKDPFLKSGKICLPDKDETLAGGHAVVAVGYNDVRKHFILRNSWSAKWGKNGYFTMPYAYIENEDLCTDFWMMKLVED